MISVTLGEYQFPWIFAKVSKARMDRKGRLGTHVLNNLTNFFSVGHLLLRERGTENILRQVLPSVTVLTLDLDLIVDVEAGVSPREELLDQCSADLLFFDQHLKALMAEEVFQFLYVYSGSM